MCLLVIVNLIHQNKLHAKELFDDVFSILIYEAQDTSRIRHVPVPDTYRHDTDTNNYSELCDLLKLLAVSAYVFVSCSVSVSSASYILIHSQSRIQSNQINYFP